MGRAHFDRVFPGSGKNAATNRQQIALVAALVAAFVRRLPFADMIVEIDIKNIDFVDVIN